MLLFFLTKRLVLASLSHSLGYGGIYKTRAGEKPWGTMEVKFFPACRPRTFVPSVTTELKMS